MCDYDVVGADRGRRADPLHFQCVGIYESRGAVQHHYVVAHELRTNDFNFLGDHCAHPEAQILRGDSILERIAAAVKGAFAETGEVQNAFAKGLAGDGPVVDGDPAEGGLTIDHRHALADFRGGDGGLLSSGAAANHDQIERSQFRSPSEDVAR